MGTMEKLAESQKKVDNEIKKHFQNKEQITDDTVGAIAHLKENLEWYKLKHKDVDLTNFGRNIVEDVLKTFDEADEKSIYKFLAKNFIFSSEAICTFVISLIPIIVVSTFYMICTDVVDIVFLGFMFSFIGVLVVLGITNNIPSRKIYSTNEGKINNERKAD